MTLGYCAKQVQAYDNDRFLCALFAPQAVQDDLLALYAFNLELAKVRETVSEPLIGRMRLQFWRDALPGVCAGEPPAHEVARPLSEAARRHGLPEEAMQGLVDARETDLDDVPPRTLDDLIGYAERTSAPVIGLSMRILGIDPTPHADFVRDAGIGVALVGLVRALPFQASTGFVTIPGELCQAAGLDPTQPHQWPKNPDVSAITLPMLAAAERHVTAARGSGKRLPRPALPAALPLSLAARYLARLKRLSGDPKAFNERPPAASRHFTLMWRSLLGRV